MKARMILATVVAALVGIPVGALALRHSAVDREDGVITRSDDGTADQGRGDAPGTRNKARSTDDDGTADQDRGDAPGTAGATSTTIPGDDDGTADQGHGDAPGTAGSGADDHGGHSGSDDGNDDNSGHGSGSDDD